MSEPIETTTIPALRAQPSLAPQNFKEAMEFSRLLSQSAFVPKDFRGKQGDILAAIQFGFELGVGPMQALQNIAVINGKPSVYGDLALALVQASGLMEYIKESDDGKCATCETKRRGYPVCITKFSNDDAKLAGLLGKSGPWTNYPSRMRMFRARGFNLRDNYADVLKGLITREEAEDFPRSTVEITPERSIDTSAERVQVDQEVQSPDDNDKASPQQRMALLDAAEKALGKAQGLSWLGDRATALGFAKRGDLTIGGFKTLMKEVVEMARTEPTQEQPAEFADDARDIPFDEATQAASKEV